MFQWARCYLFIYF